MSYTITNNIMYVRDDTGNLVPVSMIASDAKEAISAINTTAENAKNEINNKVNDANTAIKAKTDEQVARIPEVTTLAEDVNALEGKKLDQTPGTWPTWTTDEKAQARGNIDAADAESVDALKSDLDNVKTDIDPLFAYSFDIIEPNSIDSNKNIRSDGSIYNVSGKEILRYKVEVGKTYYVSGIANSGKNSAGAYNKPLYVYLNNDEVIENSEEWETKGYIDHEIKIPRGVVTLCVNSENSQSTVKTYIRTQINITRNLLSNEINKMLPNTALVAVKEISVVDNAAARSDGTVYESTGRRIGYFSISPGCRYYITGTAHSSKTSKGIYVYPLYTIFDKDGNIIENRETWDGLTGYTRYWDYEIIAPENSSKICVNQYGSDYFPCVRTNKPISELNDKECVYKKTIIDTIIKTSLPYSQNIGKIDIFGTTVKTEENRLVGKTPKVYINGYLYDISMYELHGLPVELEGKTYLEQSAFTYGDNTGNKYLSDYVDLINGKIVRNCGYISSYSGEEIGSLYMCTSETLTNGDEVVYALNTPVFEDISISKIEKAGGHLSITNDSDLYMRLEYMEAKKQSNVNVIPKNKLFLQNKSKAMTYEDNFLYFVDCYAHDAKIHKYDITDRESIIELMSANVPYDGYAYYMATGVCIYKNCLYVSVRLIAAGNDEVEGKDNGYLLVYDKENLELQDSIVLSWKGSGVYVYRNNLYVIKQMRGFDVYSLSDTKHPTLLTTVKETKATEWQKADFFTRDGHDYMVTSGFRTGWKLYDITNPSTPNFIGEWDASKLPYPMGYMQVFDVCVKYPYLYVTIAPETARRYYISNTHWGLLKFDLSDFGVYQGNTKDISYDYADIPYKFRPLPCNEGDGQPNRLLSFGDYIITNLGNMGLAIFEATEETFRFVDRIIVDDTMNTLVTCRDMIVTNDGYLFTITGDSGRTICLYSYKILMN